MRKKSNIWILFYFFHRHAEKRVYLFPKSLVFQLSKYLWQEEKLWLLKFFLLIFFPMTKHRKLRDPLPIEYTENGPTIIILWGSSSAQAISCLSAGICHLSGKIEKMCCSFDYVLVQFQDWCWIWFSLWMDTLPCQNLDCSVCPWIPTWIRLGYGQMWISIPICHVLRWFLITSALIMLSKPYLADLILRGSRIFEIHIDYLIT